MPYKASVKGMLKWLPHKAMPESGHIVDVPSSSQLAAFLRGVAPDVDQVARISGIRFNTLEKWYRPDPPEMSASSFLRVILALGVELAFVKQLREWRDASGEAPGATGVTAYQPHVVPRTKKVAEQAPARPIAKKATGSAARGRGRSAGAKVRKQG